MVQEGNIFVSFRDNKEFVNVQIVPTVPHCSLATLIGLCIRYKINEVIPTVRVQVTIQPGSHKTENEITKQLNDKERVAAALDNPTLLETVMRLTREDESSLCH